MYKSMNKASKVLALVLALVMVLGLAVPAFADTPESEAETTEAETTEAETTEAETTEAETTEAETENAETDGVNTNIAIGKTEKLGFSIDVLLTLNNVAKDADGVVKIAKSEAAKENWTGVTATAEFDEDTGVTEFSFALEPNKIYRVAIPADNAEKNTTYEYYFSTDGDAKVIATKNPGIAAKDNVDLDTVEDGGVKRLDFQYAVVSGLEDMDLPLLSVDADGQPQGEVPFEIYQARHDGKYYTFSDDKTYIKDESKPVGTNLKTNKQGYYDLADHKGDVEEIDGRKIVVLVRDGVEVAHVDLLKDQKAILPAVSTPNKITVTVLGNHNEVDKNNPDPNTNKAPRAVEGATVEIQKQTTEILREKTFDTENPLAKGVTNAQGKVVFEDVPVSQLLKVLVPTLTEGTSGEYTDISLLNRVVVTEADGYKVPEVKEFELTHKNAKEVEITITLQPINNDFFDRIDGDNRFETSVAVAEESFSGDQNVVILASGENFADSLVASSLVGGLNVPLVLSGNASLPEATAEYLEDVNAKQVIIVGNAISAAVHGQVEEMGITITTLGGATRYETAESVLRYLDSQGVNVDEVLVASGENFADALVASVPAALNRQPILLTTGDNFELNGLLKEFEVNKVTVIGGPASVSNEAFKAINVAKKERLADENRQLTSMKVADAYFSEGGKAIIVDGTDFPDAISAGQLAYKLNAPILFTESKTSLGDDLAEFLVRNKMTDITIVGGVNSVSEGVEAEIKELFLD